jgi:hypothetical protein
MCGYGIDVDSRRGRGGIGGFGEQITGLLSSSVVFIIAEVLCSDNGFDATRCSFEAFNRRGSDCRGRIWVFGE